MRLQFGIVIVATLVALCPALAQDAAGRGAFGGGGASVDVGYGISIQLYGSPVQGLYMQSWSADVPGGKIQSIRLPMHCFRQVSLTLRMDNTNLDQVGGYLPVITMQLSKDPSDAPLDDNSESAVLQLYGQRDGSRSYFYFFKTENGTRGERAPVGSTDFHEETDVSLSWNDKNEVTAKVGTDEPLTLAMDHAPASLALSISGAVATFRDVNAEFAPDRPSSTVCIKSSNSPPGGTPPPDRGR